MSRRVLFKSHVILKANLFEKPLNKRKNEMFKWFLSQL
jgi:hypothetical protein